MADQIDYELIGDVFQAVVITLDPHEAVRAEPGAMMWIEDGIAYSSNWTDGLYLVDVGGVSQAEAAGQTDQAPIPEVRAGVAGGSPENPVPFANYQYPSGWNHAAFPYRSASTDKPCESRSDS